MKAINCQQVLINMLNANISGKNDEDVVDEYMNKRNFIIYSLFV
jgi:hypothetical protein